MRYLIAAVALVAVGCSSDEGPTIEEACSDQADLFCSEECFSGWTTCREDYMDACVGPATAAPTDEEHAACLDAMVEDNLCTYPISVPSVCWL